MFRIFCEQWPNQIQNVSKLCTYIKFKSCYCKDPYVCTVYNHGHRSILAKFRSGILLLSIETGHFQNIPMEFRLCSMSNDNAIEDETHFIFDCNQYNDLREYLYEKIRSKYQHFEILSDAEKFNIVMSSVFVKHTADYLYKAYYKKRSLIYN